MSIEILVMQATSPELPSEPKIFSWCTALLCAGLFLGLLYTGEMVSTGYYYAKLQQNFTGSLTAASDLTFAVDNPEFSELFRREQKTVGDLRPLITLIDQKDGEKAALYLKRQALPKNPLTAQLAGNVKTIEALAQENSALNTELARNEVLLKTKREEYTALKAEFLRFLGDHAPNADVPERGESENEAFSFYTSGILAGLSTLPSLPENIADYKQLGGYYTLTKKGERAPSAGEAKVGLEALQSRGQSLQGDVELLRQKNDELNDKLHANNAQSDELFEQSELALRKFLRSLARPDIDANTELVYDLFQASAIRWGYVLPELWT